MAFGTKNSEAVGSASKGVGGGMSSGGKSGGGSGMGGGGGGSGGGFGGFGGFGSLKGKDGLTASQRAKGPNLGLTTGKTWFGNTAFGPAGGFATGYGTRSFGNAKNAPSQGGVSRWSNFNNPNGSPMFGNVGNNSVFAKNTGQALGMMNAMNRLMANRERGATANGYGVMGRPAFQPGAPVQEAQPRPLDSIPPWTPMHRFAGANFMNNWPQVSQAQSTVLAPFNGTIDKMGYAVGQPYNYNQGQYGPSPTSFYGSPKLGTPSLGGLLSNYGTASAGGGFFGGGLGSKPPGYSGPSFGGITN